MYGAQTDVFSNSSSPRRNLNQVRRHETYYLKGGDLHVLIDDVLFRVHRYFFVRESAYFREELEFPASPGQTAKGTEDSNAIIIVEDRQGRAIHAIDFEKFLWIFYNPLYSLYNASVEDWGRILHLANTWRFYEVKRLCVRELQKLEMLPVERIHLYQNFEVDPALLIPCWIQLCSRDTALTVEEGEKLGMKTAMLLMQARERARARDGAKSPLPEHMRAQEITALVEELFGVSAASAIPSTPPPTMNGALNGTGSPTPLSLNGSAKTHDKQNSTDGTTPDLFSLNSPPSTGRASSPAATTFSSLGSGPATNAATPPVPPKGAEKNDTGSKPDSTTTPATNGSAPNGAKAGARVTPASAIKTSVAGGINGNTDGTESGPETDSVSTPTTDKKFGNKKNNKGGKTT